MQLCSVMLGLNLGHLTLRPLLEVCGLGLGLGL